MKCFFELISLLSTRLHKSGFETDECAGDADTMIVKIASECSAYKDIRKSSSLRSFLVQK